MTRTKYSVRKGKRLSVKKVQKYAEELKAIKTKYKKLTPQVVLEEAKKKSSILYDYFEWNDKKAGDQWRLQQARILIGSIEETVVVDGKQKRIRSFFNVKNIKQENIYITVNEVAKSKRYKDQLIDQIIRDMESASTLLNTLKNY